LSDIFREVEQDLRQERLKKLWQRYGAYVIGGAALVALSLLLVSGWSAYNANQRAQTSDRFMAAQKLLTEDEDFVGAIAAFERLANTSNGGYRSLARFAQAEALVKADQEAEAIALYQDLSEDGGVRPEYRDLASLKAGTLLLGDISATEMRTRLAKVLSEDNPWFHSARELVAYSLYSDGDYEGALENYLAIVNDPATPANLRTRADEMINVIGSHADNQRARDSGDQETSGGPVRPEGAAVPADGPSAEPSAGSSGDGDPQPSAIQELNN